jgi:RNA ligase (TIGR02306 family)
MSEWRVVIVRVGPLTKHPNADRLMTTKVFDYPVITAVGEFQEGDLAVYVPVDSVVPAGSPRWAFLKGHGRIKAKRLRGIFSMGLLTKCDAAVMAKAHVAGQEILGTDVAEIMQITKYEPPEPMITGGEAEKCPFHFPKYTDIESLRRWPDVLEDMEWVAITEKVHGTSSRYAFMEERLWVGSHREIKRDSEKSVFWKAARQYDLAAKLSKHPGIAIYGEVYGWVQDLRYDHKPGTVSLALFDAMDLKTHKYLDFEAFMAFAKEIDVPTVPHLLSHPWERDNLESLAEGTTELAGDHVREGIVIRPLTERFDERVQRVILKYHGQGYLLRD